MIVPHASKSISNTQVPLLCCVYLQSTSSDYLACSVYYWSNSVLPRLIEQQELGYHEITNKQTNKQCNKRERLSSRRSISSSTWPLVSAHTFRATPIFAMHGAMSAYYRISEGGASPGGRGSSVISASSTVPPPLACCPGVDILLIGFRCSYICRSGWAGIRTAFVAVFVFVGKMNHDRQICTRYRIILVGWTDADSQTCSNYSSGARTAAIHKHVTNIRHLVIPRSEYLSSGQQQVVFMN